MIEAILPLIIATMIGTALLYWSEKKIPKVPIISALIVALFGGLTLYFDKISESTLDAGNKIHSILFFRIFIKCVFPQPLGPKIFINLLDQFGQLSISLNALKLFFET